MHYCTSRVTRRPCTFVQHVHLYNELENKCTFSGYPGGKMFLKIIIKDLSKNKEKNKNLSNPIIFCQIKFFFFFVFLTKSGLQKAAIWFELTVRVAFMWWRDLSVHVRLCTDIYKICTRKCSWCSFPKR